MGNIYVLLLMGTAILATDGLCLVGDTNMCHDGHPLILGGRIQPPTREGRKFVFLRQPGRDWSNRGLLGKRGVIRIGEKTCSGESDVMCPIPATDVPCDMSPSDISASTPSVFSNIPSTDPTVPLSDEVTEEIQPLRCKVPPTPMIFVSTINSRSVTLYIYSPSVPQAPREGECPKTTTLQAFEERKWQNVRVLNISDTGIETLTIEGLTPCSTYSYRLEIANVQKTVFSEEQDFTTDGEGYSGVIEPVGEGIKPGTLNVSWTSPNMNDTACNVRHYRIEYFLVRHKACSEDEQNVKDYKEVSGTETNVLLTSLVDCADYNISIIPVVDGNNGPIDGETVWFVESTTTAEPRGIPDGVLLESVSQSHMTFSWSPPLCASRNGIITGYSYILERNFVVVNTGTVSASSVRIAYLNPDTEYTFRVAAMTSAGSGNYSEPLTEATRSRGGCSGRQPLRLGGVLTSLTEDPAPWGSGQPIFVVYRHLSRQGRHFGHPVGHGGIIRIARSEHSPCDESARAGICPPSPETLQELPGNCPGMDGSVMTCKAAYPKFSYERKDVISFQNLSLTDVKVTWRDWEVTKDKGVGPVTGYLLRYRRRGESMVEICKGVSLHHSIFNLTANADYEFEVVPLKVGEAIPPAITPLPVNRWGDM